VRTSKIWALRGLGNNFQTYIFENVSMDATVHRFEPEKIPKLITNLYIFRKHRI
jgi:hypothetical protein